MLRSITASGATLALLICLAAASLAPARAAHIYIGEFEAIPARNNALAARDVVFLWWCAETLLRYPQVPARAPPAPSPLPPRLMCPSFCRPGPESFHNTFSNITAIELPGATLRLVTAADMFGLGLAKMAALHVSGWLTCSC